MDDRGRPTTPVEHEEEAVDGACPSFIAAMDVIGRRWSGIIIEAIGRGNNGFADISRFVGHIGDTMLAKRLKELESDGLVEREIVDGRPIRVKYSLTIAGLALLPILQDITSWGHSYSAADAAAQPDALNADVLSTNPTRTEALNTNPTSTDALSTEALNTNNPEGN